MSECNCSPGFKYHAQNCPWMAGRLQRPTLGDLPEVGARFVAACNAAAEATKRLTEAMSAEPAS